MKEIEQIYSVFLKHPIISTDSRNHVEGTIFFALSGETFNGNRFAKQALDKGAVLAIVDDPGIIDETDERLFYVPNTLKTLQDLAFRHRQGFDIPILAITGTNGKTTTKELISNVLKTEKEIIYTQGNLNNHIGVPLTLLSISNNTEIAVVEMGANHQGEIEALCRIAKPTHGIITNIGKAHLEGFGSYEGVIKTKNELYESIKESKGTLFVNQEDALLMDLSKDIQRVTYGKRSGDIEGELLDSKPFLKIGWKSKNGTLDIHTQLYGNYNFPNMMAAITAGNYFGISPVNIKKSLEEYTPKNNRSQVIKTENNTLILDAYNANPGSMSLAIETFSAQDFDDKIIILGDMFELGKDSESEHQKIIDLLKSKSFKQIILIGKDFFKIQKEQKYFSFETTKEAAEYLNNQKLRGNTILIKGSRGMQLETLVQYL
ncbi:MAG: UDP-N-acetylmuramoyl-tripeptide--D-alanyl-D-alanine ligase [Bacteroidales bacterium]|nr:UDP-N-acetylmuramoyl-tripeptide--D-alanyl-D-alanine ligase [Bacteroidales bacterium]